MSLSIETSDKSNLKTYEPCVVNILNETLTFNQHVIRLSSRSNTEKTRVMMRLDYVLRI